MLILTKLNTAAKWCPQVEFYSTKIKYLCPERLCFKSIELF